MRNIYHVVIALVIFLFLVNNTSVLATDSTPILLRFSHVVEENTTKGLGAKMLQELVEERLSGRVRVEIYPNSQKFTDRQAIRALLLGDLELAAPSFTKLRQFSSDLQVFDLPYLFRNVEQVHRFQESRVGQDLLSSMLEREIRGLRYWDNGMRVLSSNRPIVTPEDIQGLIVRIEPSLVFFQQYQQMGAIPRPLPFNRLSNVLKSGIIDGHENTWSNIHSQKLYSLCPYFLETNHSFLGYMLVTNDRFWRALPKDIRATLENIIDEVTDEVNRLALEKAEASRREIVKIENVTIFPLRDNQRQVWKSAMEPIRYQFEQTIDRRVITSARNAGADQPIDRDVILLGKTAEEPRIGRQIGLNHLHQPQRRGTEWIF